ncbi:hypothetical protein BLNAU_1189 [Blattamonas nauphoetae]|uniref:Uncharacterized protein n=1 Tax=Blattamonas nauphoetae TaxID=2049346 RepID=A0ABQ9YIP3_9EUKA|nr:hypothetical protein BLNAU_1189 [Blattamonas nauphoetae]
MPIRSLKDMPLISASLLNSHPTRTLILSPQDAMDISDHQSELRVEAASRMTLTHFCGLSSDVGNVLIADADEQILGWPPIVQKWSALLVFLRCSSQCIYLHITTVVSPPRTEGNLERAKMWPAKSSICLCTSKRHGSNKTCPNRLRKGNTVIQPTIDPTRNQPDIVVSLNDLDDGTSEMASDGTA